MHQRRPQLDPSTLIVVVLSTRRTRLLSTGQRHQINRLIEFIGTKCLWLDKERRELGGGKLALARLESWLL